MNNEIKVEKKNNVLHIHASQTENSINEQTKEKFDQDDQLSALMQQVAHISEKLGVDLLPKFKEQIELRTKILEKHKYYKNLQVKHFSAQETDK